MRKVDWRMVLPGGLLALMTMEDLRDGAPLMMADFRDVKAIRHRRTGAWVGLARERGLVLGSGPVILRDGIWYVAEDEELTRKVRDVAINSGSVELRPIG